MSGLEALRWFALAILAAIVAVAGQNEAEAANNLGLKTFPLTIVNNSGLAQDMYVYIWAQYDNKYYYISNVQGDMTQFRSTKGRFASFGINAGTAKRFVVQLPQLSAARVTISYDKPMQVLVSAAGAPSTPIGWSKSDPNLDTLFDWFEYTWADVAPGSLPALPANSTSLNTNATQVDMFGLPMMIRMTGVDPNNKPQTTAAGFSTPDARRSIVTAMARAPTPWRNLVVRNAGGFPVRVISPYNGINFGTFPQNQLAPYIAKVWSRYVKPGLTATTNATGVKAIFTGRIQDGNLVFSIPAVAGQTVTFAKPTSQMAYEGYLGTVPVGAGATLQAQAAQLATYVQAALLRSTMLTVPDISACPGVKAYYVNNPINWYSKIIHKYAYRNQAYGFGWDDNCNQASDYTVFNPKRVTLIINAIVPPKKAAH
jgi:hypothetical protein